MNIVDSILFMSQTKFQSIKHAMINLNTLGRSVYFSTFITLQVVIFNPVKKFLNNLINL